MRVHVIETGRGQTKAAAVFRGRTRLSLLTAPLRRTWFEYPINCYVVEHDDGHIVIDTGASHRMPSAPGFFRAKVEPADEVGAKMRAIGLRLEDVRLVIPTHLDVDHAGGVGHFTNAQIIVHRPEYEHSKRLMGKLRYQPRTWPEDFAPSLYNLEPDPYGPFPASRAVTDSADVRLVPIPGHSIAQVGVVVKTGGPLLFFSGDHAIRQDWLAEDLARGRLSQSLHFNNPRVAAETSRRIAEFARQFPTVLVPAHDDDAARRLESLDVARL